LRTTDGSLLGIITPFYCAAALDNVSFCGCFSFFLAAVCGLMPAVYFTVRRSCPDSGICLTPPPNAPILLLMGFSAEFAGVLPVIPVVLPPFCCVLPPPANRITIMIFPFFE
jgi:hypothetical protein